jgi:hypothetical protein
MSQNERFLHADERELNEVSPPIPTFRAHEAKVPGQAAEPQK